MKKVFGVLFVLLLVGVLLPAIASAETSGTCGAEGSNLTWVLDDDGKLTINGIGEMKNYSTSQFYGLRPWSTVKEAYISEGVTSIGNYAFYECHDLQSVSLPDSLITIGKCAFNSCWDLNEITIPRNVVTINESAFSSTGLTKITMYDNVSSIADYEFDSNSKLKTLEMIYCGGNGARGWPTYTRKKLNSVVISENTLQITNDAFYSCDGLEEVFFSDGVTSIGKDAFSGCSKLAKIVLPQSLTTISDRAFFGCSGISEVLIPEEVEDIGYGAFQNCSELSRIVLPRSVETIDETAFTNCNKINEIIVPCGSYALSWAKSHYSQNQYSIVDHSSIIDSRVEPTCLEDGLTEGAHCSICGIVLIPQENIPALGHNWNEPSYNWSADNGKVTAYRQCKRDATHVEMETAKTTSTTTATCLEDGETTFTTESFVNEAFTTQEKTVGGTPAFGHKWLEPTYTWSADRNSVMAVRICEHDSEHSESELVTTTSSVTTPATCLTEGETTWTTDAFNNEAFEVQTKTEANIPALGHDWGEATYTWSADNKSVTATRICGNDASHVETETVGATSEITKAATCEVKGETTYTSAAFENEAFAVQEKTLEDVPALGHDWGEADYTWSADNKSLTATRICANDENHVETETVGVTNEITKAATCEEKGETTYTTAVFENEAFVVQTKTLEDVPALDHDLEHHEAQAATCTEIGWEAYDTCKREGCDYTTYVEIPALDHDLEHHEAQAATCTEIGWNAYDTCKREGCGYTTYVEIAALDHDLEHHEAQAATCTEIGWEAYDTCKREGCDYTTYVEIPALDHDLEHHEAQAATCTEIGWEAYDTCKREGCDYTTYVEIPALDHDLEHHEAQAATCTEIGWDAYDTCKREGCDYTTYVEIAALDHDLEHHEAQTATCTEIGWNAYDTCKREGCDYTTYVEIPALDHDLEHHEAQAATCTEIGWEAYDTCKREGCDYTTYVENAALNHSWGEVRYVWAADNSSVTATRVCANDAKHVETETVAAIGKTTKDATRYAKGEMIYTGEDFQNSAFIKQSRTVEVPEIIPSTAVVELEKAINNLPAVIKLNDKSAVEAARSAYSALTDDQKALVNSDALSKLTAAEQKIVEAEQAKAAADQAAAKAAAAKINALPATIATTDKTAVEAAKAAYEALTDDQKALVDSATQSKLSKAETDLKAAEDKAAEEQKAAEEKAKADQAAADDAIAKINALPASAGTADKDAVAAARAAYDALTEEQKTLVNADTLNKLTAAESQVTAAEVAEAEAAAQKAAEEAAAQKAAEEAAAQKAAEEAAQKAAEEAAAQKAAADQAAASAAAETINALPASAGVADKDAVAVARAAYDALTDEQKALVGAEVAGKLAAAESQVSEAEAAAAVPADPVPGPHADDTGNYTINADLTATYEGPVKKVSKVKSAKIPDEIVVQGVPVKVTAIADKAFYKASKLTKVSIGANVKTIGKSAFASCAKLKTVSGGSGIVTIGASAFKGDKALTKITLGKKVTTIGKSAFNGCKKLKTVTIKATKLKKVGSSAFKGVSSSVTFKCPSKQLKAYKKLIKKAGAPSKAKYKK